MLAASGCTNIAFSPDSQLCFLKGCPGKYAVRCPVRAATAHTACPEESLILQLHLLPCLLSMDTLESSGASMCLLLSRRTCMHSGMLSTPICVFSFWDALAHVALLLAAAIV